MDQDRLRKLLDEFKAGRLRAEDVMSRLSAMPFEDLGFAKVDHHRALRKGFPEVVFGQGKTPEQIASLASSLLKASDRLLVTKATPEAFSKVRDQIPDADYEETARTIVVDRRVDKEVVPGVVVASGGTSDLPVANPGLHIDKTLVASQKHRQKTCRWAGSRRAAATRWWRGRRRSARPAPGRR